MLHGHKESQPESRCLPARCGIRGKGRESNSGWSSFMQYDIGYFDLEACRVGPQVKTLFGPKVLTMSPV